MSGPARAEGPLGSSRPGQARGSGTDSAAGAEARTFQARLWELPAEVLNSRRSSVITTLLTKLKQGGLL